MRERQGEREIEIERDLIQQKGSQEVGCHQATSL